MDGDPDDRRRTRWAGLVSFAARRLWQQATRTTTGRIAATTAAVAVTIAFLLVVTGIALGLAEAGVATETDADARIEPGEGETLSSVDGVEGARLGAANERAERIRSRDGVDHATPMLAETVRLETADGDSELVLLVGVVPDEESRTVAGLPTGALEAGDPHYANGSYDGPRRSEIVLSRAAANDLDASSGESVAVASARATGPAASDESASATGGAPTFDVTSVAAAEGNDRDGGVPVALVHLSELQALSGASGGQLADSVLVWGDDGAASAAAEDAYPNAAVETDDGATPSKLFGDGLAFAASLVALIVGVTICAAFVATTMGITVDEDRRMLAVLESLGFPARSRLAVVAVSTLLTTLLGAVLGTVGGLAGIVAVNAAADATVASGNVAVAHPLFAPYALAIALLAGVVAVPYPLLIAARTNVLEEVGR